MSKRFGHLPRLTDEQRATSGKTERQLRKFATVDGVSLDVTRNGVKKVKATKAGFDEQVNQGYESAVQRGIASESQRKSFYATGKENRERYNGLILPQWFRQKALLQIQRNKRDRQELRLHWEQEAQRSLGLSQNAAMHLIAELFKNL